jgi:hypothetical protein
MVALMKKAAFLPANAMARAMRFPALRTGASPEQSSYQSARDASIMTHSVMRISEDVCGGIGARPARNCFGILGALATGRILVTLDCFTPGELVSQVSKLIAELQEIKRTAGRRYRSMKLSR